MVKIYVSLIRCNRMKLMDVPPIWREQVKKEMEGING